MSIPNILNRLIRLHFYNPECEKKCYAYLDPLCMKIFDEKDGIPDAKTINEHLDYLDTLIPKSGIEERIYTAKYNNPRALRILLDHTCNFKCKYCIQENKTSNKKITKKLLDNLIDRISNNLNLENTESITFWGGEPFVYKEALLYLVYRLREYTPSSVVMATTTNGSLLTEDIVKKCIDLNLNLALSHDGPGQIYRSYDVLEESSLSHKAIMYYYNHSLSSEQLNFNILCTLTNKNIEDLEQTANFFINTFGPDIIHRVGFNPLVVSTQEHDSCSIYHDRKSAFKIFKYLMRGNTLGFDLHMKEALYRLEKESYLIRKDMPACLHARKSTLTIDLDGNVIPCQNFTKPFLGKIDNISEIKHYNYNLLEKFHHNCKRCPVLTLCGGGCPIDIRQYGTPTCKNRFHFFLGVLANAIYETYNRILIKVDFAI